MHGTDETAEDVMAPQTNEKGNYHLVASRSCSLLGISKRVIPLWVVWAVCKSVQPDEMTNVKTPFCSRLKGPAEVYADAEMTQ